MYHSPKKEKAAEPAKEEAKDETTEASKPAEEAPAAEAAEPAKPEEAAPVATEEPAKTEEAAEDAKDVKVRKEYHLTPAWACSGSLADPLYHYATATINRSTRLPRRMMLQLQRPPRRRSSDVASADALAPSSSSRSSPRRLRSQRLRLLRRRKLPKRPSRLWRLPPSRFQLPRSPS
ncbi:hypothetical protein IE53DRAFT_31529 [Violaceomyces palustris]|uniref:Uncharacterized protein n=1 Tax=Violaceomyces palustris TaxID=1673888 RepID=A0ACD0NL04_9BASI|nr:hypothetical protein IE53DRAFT_31529 [Violaceomyces palustris]